MADEVAAKRRKKFVMVVEVDALGKRVTDLRAEFERKIEAIEEMAQEIEDKDADFKERWVALVEAIQDYTRGVITKQELVERTNQSTFEMGFELPDGMPQVCGQ